MFKFNIYQNYIYIFTLCIYIHVCMCLYVHTHTQSFPLWWVNFIFFFTVRGLTQGHSPISRQSPSVSFSPIYKTSTPHLLLFVFVCLLVCFLFFFPGVSPDLSLSGIAPLVFLLTMLQASGRAVAREGGSLEQGPQFWGAGSTAFFPAPALDLGGLTLTLEG